MSNELELKDRFDDMNRVVEELLKGSQPKEIASRLNMSRALVMELVSEWRQIIHNDTNIHARAREALAGADQHYAMLIQKAWETAEQADSNQQYAVKVQSLKLAADIETKRLDALNKAGVLENSELAEQVVETERKQKVLTEILRDVVADCDHCKHEVARRLSQATKIVEAIRID